MITALSPEMSPAHIRKGSDFPHTIHKYFKNLLQCSLSVRKKISKLLRKAFAKQQKQNNTIYAKYTNSCI